MQFKTTSRRDDLHGLIYFLIYMLNNYGIRKFDQAIDKYKNDVEGQFNVI